MEACGGQGVREGVGHGGCRGDRWEGCGARHSTYGVRGLWGPCAKQFSMSWVGQGEEMHGWGRVEREHWEEGDIEREERGMVGGMGVTD